MLRLSSADVEGFSQKLEYKKEPEETRGKLFFDGEKVLRVGGGGIVDVFDFGSFVLRVNKYPHLNSRTKHERELFSRLGSIMISPNLIFYGRTSNGYEYSAVEKIAGESINKHEKALALNEIKLIISLIELLIKNGLRNDDFKPTNVMIGRKINRKERRAFLVDVEGCREESDPKILPVAYINTLHY